MTGRASVQLGRLSSVVARDVWPHEALDFTPWLLANIDVLSDLLGMSLVLERAEHPVGDFSLDLIGRDEATGEVVIVENQLEVSDHTHLGQVLTYAAGTDATTIVWVTTGFRAEHRAAIDWINARTGGDTRIFGVVIKVVRIGDSDPAPAFELVAQPNDWEKQVRRNASQSSGEVSARTMLLRRFWEQVLERIRAEHPSWSRARTTDQTWCDTSIGVGQAALSMGVRRDGLVAQLYFSHSDPSINEFRFEAIHARRKQFEAVLGGPVIWDRMDGRKGARIGVLLAGADVSDESSWPRMTDWLVAQQVALRAAFDAVGGQAAMLAATASDGDRS